MRQRLREKPHGLGEMGAEVGWGGFRLCGPCVCGDDLGLQVRRTRDEICGV